MSLAMRLILALGAVGVLATAFVGISARAAAERAVATCLRERGAGSLCGDGVDGAVTALPAAMERLNAAIVLSGGVVALLAIALAVVLSRHLAAPLEELTEETRAVIAGRAAPLRVRGSREVVELGRMIGYAIEELAAVRSRLARTERIAARREVARQVAHEIKNPLAPIQAAVETLRRLRARGSPEFEGYFDEATRTVLAEVHRIKTILAEFTEFARMPPPRFAVVDLVELARDVVALHDAHSTNGRRTVLLETCELPNLIADGAQLSRMLTNLVQNALDAANFGVEEARVTVLLEARSSREVAIKVTDNGLGVDPSVRERLCEPYVTTKPDGTGLGLAIVQTIVHEHGGELRFRDAEPRGTVFEVTLPVDGPPLLERAPDITVDPAGKE
ncbi:MAG: sensor histidine kinase [Myxococcales bacterium]|nr:sensor histidine kinase [Myxococcales bacterium]